MLLMHSLRSGYCFEFPRSRKRETWGTRMATESKGSIRVAVQREVFGDILVAIFQFGHQAFVGEVERA